MAKVTMTLPDGRTVDEHKLLGLPKDIDLPLVSLLRILDHAGMILLVAAAVDIMVWGVVGVVLYRRRNHLRKVEE